MILDQVWNILTPDYDLLRRIGKGSFGEVVQAIHRKTGKVVAIKLMRGVFENNYQAKHILSEIQILRKLSQV